MSDFLQKQAELVPGFTFTPSSTGPEDPFSNIEFLNGKRINVQARQVPVSTALTNYNTWRYSMSGQYSNLLQNGGQGQIKIDRGSGTGKCDGVPYIRLHITNTSSSVPIQYVPTPLLIQNIQLLTPDGTPIQNQDGSALWVNICQAYDRDTWRNIHVITDSSVDYEQGPPLAANFVTVLFVPLIGSMLGASDFFLPAVDGDMIMNIYFWPATTTLISGGNGTLTFCSLDVPMEQLDGEQLTNQRNERLRREVCYLFPYERIMRLVQNWNAGQTYPIPLNGIKGDVVLLRFFLRNSMTGTDLYHYNPVAQFQIQNSAGNPISGAQYIDDRYNRHIQQTDWNLGSVTENRSIYEFNFSAAKQGWMSFLLNGVKYGAYPFTTNETLQITMPAAGVNEVVTLLQGSDTGFSVTGGGYYLLWSTPIEGTQRTQLIGYNATTAQVKAALEALINFQGTVTVTGDLTAGLVLTFGGNYGNMPLYNEGYQLSAIPALFTTVSGVTGWTDLPVTNSLFVNLTTPGAYGITDGASYVLDIHAYTLSYVKQNSDRSLSVFHSG